MRIGILCESSAADKNKDIRAALEDSGHEILNIGMKKSDEEHKLLYPHTGLATGILLNTAIVDYVISGCGTGQGYAQACMQFPGVFCGVIKTPLDAWLFTQINGGNCISLSLNQGYGWAEDVNLKFIFEKLFSVEQGSGYPKHRKEAQSAGREDLYTISKIAHKSFFQILKELPVSILGPVLNYPEMKTLLHDSDLKKTKPEIWGLIETYYKKLNKNEF